MINPELSAGSIAVAFLVGAVVFFLILSLVNLLQIIFLFLCSNRCDDYIDK